jgi:hypothetical protein
MTISIEMIAGVATSLARDACALLADRLVDSPDPLTEFT